MSSQPLAPQEARKLLTAILRGGGRVAFTKHALKRMRQREINEAEVVAVLRGGVVETAERREMPNGVAPTWRYLVVGRLGVTVVVAFDSETQTVVVTAWR